MLNKHSLSSLLITQSWLDSRLLSKLLREFAHGKVADIGCGSGRLKYLLDPSKTKKYVGVDMFEGPDVDIVSDVHKLALKNNQFDTCISNAVLEHVAHPEQVISEMHRILRPGGTLIVTVPFLQPVHYDPTDYRRLTEEGLRLILEEIGFTNFQTYKAPGLILTFEYLIFATMVQNIKLKTWRQSGILMPFVLAYYGLLGLLFILLKVMNMLLLPVQKYDRTTYAGFALTCEKQ